MAPKQIVGGKFAGDAPGALEKWKSDSTGGDATTVSTANCTVLDVRDNVWLPTVHSAVAVFVMNGDCVCANAGRLATGRSIPAVSAPAHLIYLVNTPIEAKGDVG